MELIAIDSEAFKEIQDRLKAIEERITSIDPNSSKNPEYLDNSEVLRMLKISSRCLQTWRDEGKIPFTRISRKIYYRLCDIEEILKANYNHGNKNNSNDLK